MDSSRPSRKGKERDLSNEQFAESFQDRMIALQRKNAASSRPRERLERPDRSAAAPQQLTPQPTARTDRPPKSPSAAARVPPSPRKPPSPHLIVSRSALEADPEEFSRRLKISSSHSRPSPSSRHAGAAKLFNPDTDPIPMRRTAEPEAMSDAASSSHVSRGLPHAHSHGQQRDAHHSRQLFDHRKDDPVRFSVLARPQGRPAPTSKSSGDYISASSTSSYATSIISSSFTLSSDTTGGSSASSALFDNGRPNHETGTTVFAQQLKNLYRSITLLEKVVKGEEAEQGAEESSRTILQGKKVENEEVDKEMWRNKIAMHKQLAEYIHNLLQMSLAPGVPATLRDIPKKYGMMLRLWNAFYPLLEQLRCASDSPIALEHLQDFIYYAYTFYSSLLEEQALNVFKSFWLEALGDLARYRMIIATVSDNQTNGSTLTAAAVSSALVGNSSADAKSNKSGSNASVARIDQDDEPSVGVAAARLLEVEPESERWRTIAREWYCTQLVDTPGTGKLHHHLGLLSRDVEGEDLRAMYHFVKSLISLHTYLTSREAILPIWSIERQSRRGLPDARAPELFVYLHGMLFTNIQLDDFQPTLARFMERLSIEGAEEREWIMMATTNIGALLEYGKPTGTLKKTGGVGLRETNGAPVRVVAKRSAANDGDRMDVDDTEEPKEAPTQDSPPASEAEADQNEPSQTFKLAMQLTFTMLAYVLRNPTRRVSPFAKETPNPYLSIMLTFLATVLKNPLTQAALERCIPWEELSLFFARIPRKIMHDQGLGPNCVPAGGQDRWPMLTSGCAPPLPEDWCLRGMEWINRKVHERGFWKNSEDRRPELELLESRESAVVVEGQIEDDDEQENGVDGAKRRKGASGEAGRRWVRIVRCAVSISNAVDGFTWVEGTRNWLVEGALEEKVALWKEEDRVEREQEERRRMRMHPRWDDSMEVDDDLNAAVDDESDDDDDSDSDIVKGLKARRKYLQSLIQEDQHAPVPRSPPRRAMPRRADSRPLLKIVKGYSVLVVDTNILLSSLPMFASLIESLSWTVVVPLPVIMELDGLASNASKLGEAAREALSYITSHIRTNSKSLKVQTSRGNYLPTLAVRTEEIDFVHDGSNSDRNMDDLILKAAIWQDEHWTNRSAILGGDVAQSQDTRNAVKVVLLTLDRNLRLKARSRSLPAASERDLAAILESVT
ncbi:hypothetical protein HGRIS_013287 [Hohenbuehelia grisea]|uniref:PIN domain-containing protein n=1 Tax=Hohenbuehelia grisea TaxID=104357 RepID=A0ABR3IV93_9AGAR